MNRMLLSGGALALALVAGFASAQTPEAAEAQTPEPASAQTLEEVRDRGTLNCGTNTGLVGFAAQDGEGVWRGFDVALCRALAAAVLGDPAKVEFFPTTGESRFEALADGDVDLLARNTTWTFGRDVEMGFTFTGVTYYDGQGFIVPKDLGVTSAKQLEGATICVQTGTTTALNVEEWFRAEGMSYQPLPMETTTDTDAQFQAGACDAYSSDISQLAASRATYEEPAEWIILPEIISKEPLGPLVREGDDRWADIVRWTLHALVAAEEYGVTAENAEEMATSSTDPEVRRLLGAEGGLGTMIGLDDAWARRAIIAGGNYGEIFAATIGEGTPINIPRGLNAQWKDGGLIYAPPFR
jgi:general L-amino acid transport system substrate-binding protein